MKRPREDSQRWLRQADHDLETAKRLREWCPADACYFAEQSSQKSLKAFLYFAGSRGEREHSVVFLAERCAERDPSFSQFVDGANVLDQFYIATRYPDAVADPAVPFESYTADQAREAICLASEILELVRTKVSA